MLQMPGGAAVSAPQGQYWMRAPTSSSLDGPPPADALGLSQASNHLGLTSPLANAMAGGQNRYDAGNEVQTRLGRIQSGGRGPGSLAALDHGATSSPRSCPPCITMLLSAFTCDCHLEACRCHPFAGARARAPVGKQEPLLEMQPYFGERPRRRRVTVDVASGLAGC